MIKQNLIEAFKFNSTTGGLILSYAQYPMYNSGYDGNGGYVGGGGNYKYGYLRLYNYKVNNMTNLTEVLTSTSAENILILMREYDSEVNDSYFIQYSAPEFDDYTTIRPALSLLDPSIFKTVTDNYFVLNTK